MLSIPIGVCPTFLHSSYFHSFISSLWFSLYIVYWLVFRSLILTSAVLNHSIQILYFQCQTAYAIFKIYFNSLVNLNIFSFILLTLLYFINIFIIVILMSLSCWVQCIYHLWVWLYCLSLLKIFKHTFSPNLYNSWFLFHTKYRA